MLMIAAAIMLIIYTTNATMLSPKSPQSIHKIPDAIQFAAESMCFPKVERPYFHLKSLRLFQLSSSFLT